MYIYCGIYSNVQNTQDKNRCTSSSLEKYRSALKHWTNLDFLLKLYQKNADMVKEKPDNASKQLDSVHQKLFISENYYE